MPRRIKRRAIGLAPLLDHYLNQRMMRERLVKEEDRDKAELMEALTAEGEETAEGHHVINVEELDLCYVDAKGNEKKLKVIKRQKRVSQNLDEPMTMLLLHARGLVDECTETITVLSEDKVLAANYAGKITDEELKGLYTETVTYAFVMEYD